MIRRSMGVGGDSRLRGNDVGGCGNDVGGGRAAMIRRSTGVANIEIMTRK